MSHARKHVGKVKPAKPETSHTREHGGKVKKHIEKITFWSGKTTHIKDPGVFKPSPLVIPECPPHVPVIVQPTPEPTEPVIVPDSSSTFALLGLGIMALFAIKRRLTR